MKGFIVVSVNARRAQDVALCCVRCFYIVQTRKLVYLLEKSRLISDHLLSCAHYTPQIMAFKMSQLCFLLFVCAFCWCRDVVTVTRL